MLGPSPGEKCGLAPNRPIWGGFSCPHQRTGIAESVRIIYRPQTRKKPFRTSRWTGGDSLKAMGVLRRPAKFLENKLIASLRAAPWSSPARFLSIKTLRSAARRLMFLSAGRITMILPTNALQHQPNHGYGIQRKRNQRGASLESQQAAQVPRLRLAVGGLLAAVN